MTRFIRLVELTAPVPTGMEETRYYLRAIQSHDGRLSSESYSLKGLEEAINILEEDLQEIRKEIARKIKKKS